MCIVHPIAIYTHAHRCMYVIVYAILSPCVYVWMDFCTFVHIIYLFLIKWTVKDVALLFKCLTRRTVIRCHLNNATYSVFTCISFLVLLCNYNIHLIQPWRYRFFPDYMFRHFKTSSRQMRRIIFIFSMLFKRLERFVYLIRYL